MPLLMKLEEMMAEADLCLFDFTTHNANVATEFGIARGRGYDWAILYNDDEQYNPRPDHESTVFSDVKGWDSILYRDPAMLETELRRLLPEYLARIRERRHAGNVGSRTRATPRLGIAPAADTPRLYATVSVRQPGFIGFGSGPIQKLGHYGLRISVRNGGKGAANRVRASMSGAKHVQKLGTIEPRAKEQTFDWSLEDQEAYNRPAEFPEIWFQYEDDAGRRYEQRGPLNVKPVDGGFTFEGQSLGPVRQIERFSAPYDETEQ
jgi:hypothetical protein